MLPYLVGIQPARWILHFQELCAAGAGSEGGPSVNSAILLIDDPMWHAGTLKELAGLSLLELLLGKTGGRAGIDEVVETGEGLGLIREKGVSIGELVTGAALLRAAPASETS